MNHVFIVNPVSGSGRYTKVLSIVQTYFKDKEGSFELRFTEGVGHATKIASEYFDHDTVLYSVGGDGTSHEILNGLNEGVSLAIIPVGSGNDFWRNIDYEGSLEDVVIATIEGHNLLIDVGVANGRKYLNSANIGFDAMVNLAVNKFRFEWFPRKFIYAIFAIKSLIRKHTVDFSIDGVKHSALLASFMNGRWYGGGFMSAPRASLTDGLLDVCIVKDISRRRILSLFPVYYKGKHLDLDVLTYSKLKSFKISSDSEIVYGLDGEIFFDRSISFSILASGLSLRVPNRILIK